MPSGPTANSSGKLPPWSIRLAWSLNWSTCQSPKKWPASCDTMLPTARPTKATRLLAGVMYVLSDGSPYSTLGSLSTSSSTSAVSSVA